MKLEVIKCGDCQRQFQHPRAVGQRGRPPKYCQKCKVIRVLKPHRCMECRRQQALDCNHKLKEQK